VTGCPSTGCRHRSLCAVDRATETPVTPEGALHRPGAHAADGQRYAGAVGAVRVLRSLLGALGVLRELLRAMLRTGPG
jgi:hypothetical protein